MTLFGVAVYVWGSDNVNVRAVNGTLNSMSSEN